MTARAGTPATFLTQMEQVLGTCVDRGSRSSPTPAASTRRAVRRAGAGDRRAPRCHGRRRPHRGRRPDRAHRRAAPAPRQPRHGRAADRRPDQRQRLPRRLRHHGRPRRRRRRRRVPAGHRRRRSSSARRRGGGAGRRPTGTGWPARSPPATSSSAAPRPSAATTPSSPSCRTCPSRSGSRSPRSTTTGPAVITKHPGAGGAVTVETVTAQLLYEIGPPAYAEPRRRDPLRHVAPRAGRHRTACGSAAPRGEPAPPTTKVAINYDGGFRNRMTFVLTGPGAGGQGGRGWPTPCATAWAARIGCATPG